MNPETGWGLVGESWTVMQSLERYGGQTWFRLGDRDLATHLYRTQRLAEAGAVASVGSTGDSYDNALAEAFNSLFKAELIRNKGPWKNIDDLEIAVAEYIDWFNHRRLHGEIGLVPPVECEEQHYRHNPAPTTVGASVQSLH